MGAVASFIISFPRSCNADQGWVDLCNGQTVSMADTISQHIAWPSCLQTCQTWL